MKVLTDICIIGAGPVGLFAVFQAGLLKMRCHVIDVSPEGGSQVATKFQHKQMCSVFENSNISASGLIGDLMEQINPFDPGFTREESIERLSCLEDGRFKLMTENGTQINCRAVVFIGQHPILGLISDCNVKIDHSIIEVNNWDYQTIIPGIFAIEDYYTYSDTMVSLIPGFIKASLVSQGAFKFIHPLKNLCFDQLIANDITCK